MPGAGRHTDNLYGPSDGFPKVMEATARFIRPAGQAAAR